MSILKANRIENLTTTDGGININNSGNVGVGTDSPSFNLEVKDASGDCVVALNSPNSSNTEILFGDPDSSYSGRVRYGNSTNHLQFNTNASERLRIDSSGNVGIGTSSPLRALHVAGAGDTGLMLQTTNAVNDKEIWEIQAAADASNHANLIFRSRVNAGTGGTEAMRIDSSGKVGIGTGSNLNGLLTLHQNDDQLFLKQSDGDSGFLLGSNNTNGNLNFVRRSAGSNTTIATFRAAGGLTFNGDTAAANALSDYERGTWTPTIKRSSTNPSVTYTEQEGRYVKVGDIVTCFFDVTASSISGGSGSPQVHGLPFTMPSSHAGYSAIQWRSSNGFAAGAAQTILRGYVEQGTTYFVPQLDNMGTSGYGFNSQPSWNSSGRITGYVTYQTGT